MTFLTYADPSLPPGVLTVTCEVCGDSYRCTSGPWAAAWVQAHVCRGAA